MIRRPRLTIRRLMVAVGTVALLLGGYVKTLELKRRATVYLEKARSHADLEAVLQSIGSKDGLDAPVDVFPGPGLQSVRLPLRAVADREATLKRKYERAARYPWLPVEPDPPEPE